jgi:hypothetical protein
MEINTLKRVDKTIAGSERKNNLTLSHSLGWCD